MSYYMFFLAAVFICYTVYYIVVKTKSPRIYSGNGPFCKHVLSRCSTLSDTYWPTWWAFNRHVMTIARVVLQRAPDLMYKREIFTTPDGGHLALDWPDSNYHCIEDGSPLLLILTGLTSSSREVYVQWLVVDGLSQGYRPVVMSFRGLGGVLLKTPRGYCANTDDLEPVIDHIHHTYTGLPIVAIGVSLGGMVLIQHLRKRGNLSGLSAVATFSSAWNVHVSVSALEQPISQLLYNRHLTGQLVKYVERNSKRLLESKSIDKEEGSKILEKVRKCSTIQEFDSAITVPMFGYPSLYDYYENASNANKLHQVKTPLLSVNAMNDPFVPLKTLPIHEFCANPNTVLVLTAHGGHFGFLEGWFLARNGTWMDRLAREFLASMKLYNKK